jgi:CRP-like cAMP-binding protein
MAFQEDDILVQKMRDVFKFFNVISDQEVNDFLKYCEKRQLSAGETLWQAGDQDNYAAFIISGRLGIKRKTEFEKRHVIVGIFETGSVVGELCLLTNNIRSVTAEVLEPVDLLLLESNEFEKMLASYPLLGLKLIKHIFAITSRRLRSTTDRIISSVF